MCPWGLGDGVWGMGSGGWGLGDGVWDMGWSHDPNSYEILQKVDHIAENLERIGKFYQFST